MNKEIYGDITKVATTLEEKVEELNACLYQKQELLKKIERLKKVGTYEAHEKEIEEEMQNNIENFKMIVEEIKKLNDC